MKKELIVLLILAVSEIFISCGMPEINANEELKDSNYTELAQTSEQPEPTTKTVEQQLEKDMQWLNEIEEDPAVINPVSEKATVLSNGDMYFIQDSGDGDVILFQEAGHNTQSKVYQGSTYIYDIVSNRSDEVFFASWEGIYQLLGKNQAEKISLDKGITFSEIYFCTDNEIVFAERMGYEQPALLIEYDFEERVCTQLLENQMIYPAHNGSHMSDEFKIPLVEVGDLLIYINSEKPSESLKWELDEYDYYVSADSKYAIVYSETNNRMDIINFETKKKISIEDCNPELSDAIDQYFVLKDMNIIFFWGNLVYQYNLKTQVIEVIFTLDLSGEDIFYHGFDQGIMGSDGYTLFWDVLESVGPDEEDINQNDDWWIVAYDINAKEIEVLEHHDEIPYEWTDGPNQNYFWERWRDRMVLLSFESGTSDYKIEYVVDSTQ